MLSRFSQISEAMPDGQLRAQVSNYFARHLSTNPTKEERDAAALVTIREFPALLDYYIRLREEAGDQAEANSLEKVQDTLAIFVEQLKRVVDDLTAKTDFYARGWSSYSEALSRVKGFKQYVENQDGWKLINRGGKPFAQEKEVQLYFGLIWFGSAFDVNREPNNGRGPVNREPNNGRGPVDYKVSIGAADKSLIEFKLASNSQLKRNLQKQVRMSQVPWNFGGGPMIIRLRSRFHHDGRHRQSARRHAVRGRRAVLVGAGGR